MTHFVFAPICFGLRSTKSENAGMKSLVVRPWFSWKKFRWKNKTGTSQVGAILKAQKYSRNNYWKHSENFFSKKYFLKKVARCRKTQKEAI